MFEILSNFAISYHLCLSLHQKIITENTLSCIPCTLVSYIILTAYAIFVHVNDVLSVIA